MHVSCDPVKGVPFNDGSCEGKISTHNALVTKPNAMVICTTPMSIPSPHPSRARTHSQHTSTTRATVVGAVGLGRSALLAPLARFVCLLALGRREEGLQKALLSAFACRVAVLALAPTFVHDRARVAREDDDEGGECEEGEGVHDEHVEGSVREGIVDTIVVVDKDDYEGRVRSEDHEDGDCARKRKRCQSCRALQALVVPLRRPEERRETYCRGAGSDTTFCGGWGLHSRLPARRRLGRVEADWGGAERQAGWDLRRSADCVAEGHETWAGQHEGITRRQVDTSKEAKGGSSDEGGAGVVVHEGRCCGQESVAIAAKLSARSRSGTTNAVQPRASPARSAFCSHVALG